ncbi:hypothetical protein ACIRG5_38815 [Lentzea sp. NPDC102401]|uniref:hypothetical protein n=1 Tax=Lentzea sp. NPDC102401 TaxID=3364128 RepID=UPI00381886ED
MGELVVTRTGNEQHRVRGTDDRKCRRVGIYPAAVGDDRDTRLIRSSAQRCSRAKSQYPECSPSLFGTDRANHYLETTRQDLGVLGYQTGIVTATAASRSRKTDKAWCVAQSEARHEITSSRVNFDNDRTLRTWPPSTKRHCQRGHTGRPLHGANSDKHQRTPPEIAIKLS